MNKPRSYRDLAVWQKAMDLVVVTYEQTGKFPSSELYGLMSQMRRAAVSVPSNIAEGQARNSTGEFLHALGVSYGSLAELETQFELATRLNFLKPDQRDSALQQCDEIGRMLNGLMRSLRSTDH